MLLSAHIDNFLNDLNENKNSKLTIKNYKHYLKRFLEFSKNIDPKEIKLDLINSYKTFLAAYLDPKTKKQLKKNTQNYFVIALRAFLRYLKKINVNCLDANLVFLSTNEPKKRILAMQSSDLQLLLQSPNLTDKSGIRDKAILETLYSTGLRVSELASLNRDLINLNSPEVKIFGIGGKARYVNLSDNARIYLSRYLEIRKDTFKPLFIRFQGKVDLEQDGERMRLTTRSIERILEKYVKSANLSFKATPNTLRHSLALDLLTKGVDIRSIQERLGHRNISTTSVYIQN